MKAECWIRFRSSCIPPVSTLPHGQMERLWRGYVHTSFWSDRHVGLCWLVGRTMTWVEISFSFHSVNLSWYLAWSVHVRYLLFRRFCLQYTGLAFFSLWGKHIRHSSLFGGWVLSIWHSDWLKLFWWLAAGDHLSSCVKSNSDVHTNPHPPTHSLSLSNTPIYPSNDCVSEPWYSTMVQSNA